MALNITSPIHTFQGITLNQSYARIEVKDGQGGHDFEATIYIYPSKEVYQSGAEPLGVKKLNDYSMLYPLDTWLRQPYNREVDGGDLLALAHQAFVSKLAEHGIVAEISLS